MTALKTQSQYFQYFRKDINGLRAWAVVAVILYHFGVAGFSGGFVGVDIFFVISGYLMTGIIVNSLENSVNAPSFSLGRFYLARARRILPALWVLCISLLSLGWFWLSSADYTLLGSHASRAVSFISNIKFFKEAGYFDASSFDKWLLHTWSLSVEWQFYILLPLVLMLIWKLKPARHFITLSILIACLISFYLSIHATQNNASSAFYLLRNRAWEMLVGGLVFLLANKIRLSPLTCRGIEWLGFGLICYATVFFKPTDIWPGYLALVPVLGAVLVLLANRQQSWLTAPQPAQWLGSMSYSLYLWHWPLVVALHYSVLDKNNTAIIIALLLTLLLGCASYWLVENPARKKLTQVSPKAAVIIMVTGLALVVLPARAIKSWQGIPSRLPENIIHILAETKNKNPRIEECHVSGDHPVPECRYGGKTLGAIVIGDSHAASIVRTLEKALPHKHLHVLDWSLSACSTIKGLQRKNDEQYSCGQFIDYALEKQKTLDKKVPIIIVNRLSIVTEGFYVGDGGIKDAQPEFYVNKMHPKRDDAFYQSITDAIVDTACQLAETRPVYMLRPTPEFETHVPNAMVRHALLFNDNHRVSINRADYQVRHQKAMAAQDRAADQCGVKILDPLPYLCDQQYCYGDQKGLPIYYDDDHLNERGAQLLQPLLRSIFNPD